VHHKQRIAVLNSGGDADIDKMFGIEFEEWIIASIKRAGLPDARPTRRTGDQGADIIVRYGRTIVVQAKCYQQTVGNDAVQQAHAAKTHYGAEEAWVVTNSRFTRSARELSTSTGVRLIDRSSVRDIGVLVVEALKPASTTVEIKAESRPPEQPQTQIAAAAEASTAPPVALAEPAGAAIPSIASFVVPPIPQSPSSDGPVPPDALLPQGQRTKDRYLQS
jgi:hypothetical protein